MKGTILTNDPSMTAWGWVIIDWQGQVLDAGCITTKPEAKKKRIRKGDDNVRRTGEIVYELKRIINKYNVNYLLTELPHGSQSYNGATMIGRTEGIMETISQVLEIGIEWYSENDAKKFLFGKKAISKNEMVEKVKELLGDKMQKWTNVQYIDQAMADALAIYLVAKNQSSTLKLLKNQ